jgi:ubiquinone biosynthesis protein
MNARIYRPAYRKRKAYAVALRVLWSYLWLNFVSKFRGKGYQQRKISSVNERNATRIKNTLLELQGLFIKVGQLISILSNILPNEFRDPLESLQDKVPARPFEEIAATLQSALGRSPDQLFDHFEKTPIAAASIGQVHRARLNQEEVVVKIQHANIREIAEADLTIIKNLMRLITRFYRIRGFEHLYEQVRLMIMEELDYEREALAMQLIGESLAQQEDAQLEVPAVYPQFTTPKTLVSRFYEGVAISNLPQLDAWQVDRNELMERLIIAYCKMILLDGYYHADPHPGNILVNKQGKLILLDFGATAQLSPRMKNAIPKLIQAAVSDDDDGIVEALQEMGCISRTKDAYQTAQGFLETLKEFLQSEVEFDNLQVTVNANTSSVLRLVNQLDLRELTQAFEIPKDWVLLNRTITLLGGMSNEVAPELNPVQVVRPFIKKHLIFTRKGITEFVWNTFKTQAMAAIALPAESLKVLKQANKGKLEVQIRRLDRGFQLLYLFGQQVLWLAITLGAFHFSERYPEFSNWWLAGCAVGGVLFLRALWKGRRIFVLLNKGR